MNAKSQKGPSPPVSEKTVVADADEMVRQDVKKKAAQEFGDRNREFPLLVAVCGIPPAKGHLVLLEIDQAMVGNRDTVRVAAQVLQNMVGAGKGWFAVNDPVLTEEWAKKGSESLGLGDGF